MFLETEYRVSDRDTAGIPAAEKKPLAAPEPEQRNRPLCYTTQPARKISWPAHPRSEPERRAIPTKTDSSHTTLHEKLVLAQFGAPVVQSSALRLRILLTIKRKLKVELALPEKSLN